MSKTKRPLAEAESIVADLAPSCACIEVAGPARRCKEVVGDIEMVAIPHLAPAGPFGDCTANLLWGHLHASDASGVTKGDRAAGRYYQLALSMHAGLQLDLFLAQPDNRGLTLLVRTGSAAFSTAMLARWKRRQGIGRDQSGSVDGRLVTRDGHVVPTPEEETVFQLLGMQPVPPERRSGAEW